MPSTSATTLERAREGVKPTFEPLKVKPYQYWGKITKVVDGDTVDAEVVLGFNVTVAERFRLLGVAAPEISGPSAEAAGKKALTFLRNLIPEGTWVEMRTYFGRREKYRRWLCEIFVNGVSVNERLLRGGYAKPYKP